MAALWMNAALKTRHYVINTVARAGYSEKEAAHRRVEAVVVTIHGNPSGVSLLLS